MQDEKQDSKAVKKQSLEEEVIQSSLSRSGGTNVTRELLTEAGTLGAQTLSKRLKIQSKINESNAYIIPFDFNQQFILFSLKVN